MGLFNPIRPLTLTGLFLWFFVSILLIAAAAIPKWASQGNFELGAYTFCTTGTGGTCWSIDSSCTYNGFTLSGCSKFGAFRAFLIMGLLLCLFITIYIFVLFFMHQLKNPIHILVYHVLAAFEWFFVLVAWSVFAGWASDQSLSSNKSDGFGLGVSAWVFGMLAWAAFGLGCFMEDEGYVSTQATQSTAGAPSTDVGIQQQQQQVNTPPPNYMPQPTPGYPPQLQSQPGQPQAGAAFMYQAGPTFMAGQASQSGAPAQGYPPQTYAAPQNPHAYPGATNAFTAGAGYPYTQGHAGANTAPVAGEAVTGDPYTVNKPPPQ